MSICFPHLTVAHEITGAAPDGCTGVIVAEVEQSEANAAEFATFLDVCHAEIEKETDLSAIKANPAIAATRLAYKKLGKDPNRYRPAAEQLLRRAASGKLYRVCPLVDIGNVVSMRTGFSLGVLDLDAICGTIVLRRGTADDDYNGIGRGKLNIEGLPTYADEKGAFATPTSDSERTSIKKQTKHIIIFINDFGINDDHLLAAAETLFKDLLHEFLVVKSYQYAKLYWAETAQ